MKVRQGWSGEVEPNRWAKFDIEVDETDLHRLFIEAGLDMVVNVTTAEVFQILEAEAERLVMVKLVTRYGFSQQEGAARIAKLVDARNRVLDSLKKPDEEPPF